MQNGVAIIQQHNSGKGGGKKYQEFQLLLTAFFLRTGSDSARTAPGRKYFAATNYFFMS